MPPGADGFSLFLIHQCWNNRLEKQISSLTFLIKIFKVKDEEDVDWSDADEAMEVDAGGEEVVIDDSDDDDDDDDDWEDRRADDDAKKFFPPKYILNLC